jgi:hypothetical protein
MSPPPVEPPVAWRVCVQPANGRPFDREFRPKPHYTVCTTKSEAEREKERQRAHHGADAAIHIEPVFPTRAERKRLLVAMQDSLSAAGWPVQRRPPRPGMPAKGRKR